MRRTGYDEACFTPVAVGTAQWGRQWQWGRPKDEGDGESYTIQQGRVSRGDVGATVQLVELDQDHCVPSVSVCGPSAVTGPQQSACTVLTPQAKDT